MGQIGERGVSEKIQFRLKIDRAAGRREDDQPIALLAQPP